MATNNVAILGGDNHLFVSATNLSGDLPIEFESGAFRSSPEERRVAVMFLVIGDKVLKLRLELTSPIFVEHSIAGQDLYQDRPETGVRVGQHV